MSESSAAKEIPAKSEADMAARRMQNQKKGVISRIWKSVFRSRREDDYEKRLQHLSKEEAAVHARIKRRAITARNIARNIFVLFGILEVAAVAFAIMAINALDMNWIGKTVRCLPAILWPALIFFIYTTVVRFMKMLDRKDQKTLERLRDERKAKLDELKERTNYYTTQQLIQRYDLDPAAKAAAASVLASKLGFDSGIKVFLEDESAKSNDVELAQTSTGLRNRRQTQSLSRNNSTESGGTPRSMSELQNELGVTRENHMLVEHHQGSSPRDGGWIGRLAALLVGEDPSHCFALICGNCLRHNGLARKEDFPHTTYYCPHCHALNTSSSSNQTVELESGLSTPRDSVEYTLLRSLSNASSCSASEAHDLHAGSIE